MENSENLCRTRIKTFQRRSSDDDIVNDWLSQQKDIRVKNITSSFFGSDRNFREAVVITYELTGEGREPEKHGADI